MVTFERATGGKGRVTRGTSEKARRSRQGEPAKGGRAIKREERWCGALLARKREGVRQNPPKMVDAVTLDNKAPDLLPTTSGRKNHASPPVSSQAHPPRAHCSRPLRKGQYPKHPATVLLCPETRSRTTTPTSPAPTPYPLCLIRFLSHQMTPGRPSCGRRCRLRPCPP